MTCDSSDASLAKSEWPSFIVGWSIEQPAPSVAQLRHDHATAEAWIGEEIVGITLGHTVPFFADVAPRFFGRLIDEGVEFVPLEEAMSGAPHRTVGSVVSSKFLVLQQKLAEAANVPIAPIPETQRPVFERIVEKAEGQTG